MAYGIELKTSSGRQNILEVRTWVVFKDASTTFPSGSSDGTVRYITYPANWLSESQSANSFVSSSGILNIVTPPEDNPYQGGYFIDDDNAGSRLKITLSVPIDTNHTYTVSTMFLARGA